MIRSNGSTSLLAACVQKSGMHRQLWTMSSIMLQRRYNLRAEEDGRNILLLQRARARIVASCLGHERTRNTAVARSWSGMAVQTFLPTVACRERGKGFPPVLLDAARFVNGRGMIGHRHMTTEEEAESKFAEKWIKGFETLCRYKEANGDVLVPQRYITTDGFKLGKWTNRQRLEYQMFHAGKTSPLTKERIVQLDQIGFEWDARDSLWTMQFEALVQYKKDNGNCLVPIADDVLGCWVQTQRQQMTKKNKGLTSYLTPQRIEKLNSLGFEWDTHQCHFDHVVGLLRDFIKVHGHQIIPEDYEVEGINLKFWVENQRKEYQKHKKGSRSLMTSERMSKLEDIGFDLDPRETKWKRSLELAHAYKSTTGKWSIPKDYVVDGIRPGAFLQRQVAQYRRFKNGVQSPMTPERIDALREIGFDLDKPPAELWLRMHSARH